MIIKSRRMRWMGNIAGIEKRPLGKLRIILKCI
jgi:hypothetical protein